MRRICSALVVVAASGMLLLVSGCGGGDDPAETAGNSNSNNNGGSNTSGDLAPASIGNNTIHAQFQSPHNPADTIRFYIATTGTTTGNYIYEEENLPTNSGTYTWTKTGPNTAVLDTSNNGSLTFTYTGTRAGSYEYARPGYDEIGTFTTER